LTNDYTSADGASIAAAVLFWTIARLAGGRGSLIGLWRCVGFAIFPIVLGVFGFLGQLIGAGLAVPFYVWAIVETQAVRVHAGILAVAAPIVLYGAFFVYYAAFID